MSTAESVQEALVTITGEVTRLMPCARHEGSGTGEQSYDGAGRPMQNPNGYRHDCGACAATPTRIEILEGVVIHEQP